MRPGRRRPHAGTLPAPDTASRLPLPDGDDRRGPSPARERRLDVTDWRRRGARLGAMATPPPGAQPEDPRLRARADLLWYLRHADALSRWPVLPEAWARRVERRRLEPPDRRGADPRLR